MRRRRKRNKLCGSRTHGKGNTKNNRGGGSRGGRGRAGSHKHKFSKYWMTFGIKKRLKPRKCGAAIKLGVVNQCIDSWLSRGLAEKEGNTIIVDGIKIGYGKVLGTGTIGRKIAVRNMVASESARKKIEAAGGTVEGAAAGMEEAGEEEAGAGEGE